MRARRKYLGQVCHLRGTGSNSCGEDAFALYSSPMELEDNFMTSLKHKSTIPLDHAVLCLDCNCVSDANRECPACTSRALMNLSVVLNRPTEFAEYARLANAA